MGYMPPRPPSVTFVRLWIAALVESSEPERPTWGSPPRLRVRVLEVFDRGVSLPEELTLTLSAPPGSGQQYFYATRFLGGPGSTSPEAELARAQVDAQALYAPRAGERILAGLARNGESWSFAAWDGPWEDDTAEARSKRGLPPAREPEPEAEAKAAPVTSAASAEPPAAKSWWARVRGLFTRG